MLKNIDFMKTSKVNGDSLNQQQVLLEMLKNKAPEIFSDGKINTKQLKATLGEDALADADQYGLSWSGKMDCFRAIQESTTNTLKPVREESVDFDNTENLFIEGDNLQVLKTLQKSYYGKIKMIYIDPPYNTGNDFIYNDKFAQNKREYLEEIGALDKDGNVLNASLYKQNTKDSGRYHSAWLNMIYPRLFLARNLLQEDGVIFVSIDDNEVHNLRLIMDEIFGEENFVAQFIWEKRITRENRKSISVRHDYIICYARSANTSDYLGLLEMSEEALQRYRNPDNDPRGSWTSVPAIAQGGHGTKNQFYTLETPAGRIIEPPSGSCWRYTKEKMLKEINLNNIWFGSDGTGVPRIKKFLNQGRQGLTPETMWWARDVGTNDSAKREMVALFEGFAIFETPKPASLIERMIEIGTDKDSTILDFFAGSGTTADAVMNRNAKDNGKRKWICVQLPEVCKEESEAAKADYKTIADIAKERIRRAGSKIKKEHPDIKFDSGFKVFKLDESNFKIWDTQVENIEQLEQQMLDMFDVVRDGSTIEAMLYELILKSGKDLNTTIAQIGSDSDHTFKINDGSLVISLVDKMTEELFKKILAEKPKKIVMLDSAFENNDQLKTNLLLQAKGVGVDEVRVI
jgi:adenine-specific DNA-methyltransferase